MYIYRFVARAVLGATLFGVAACGSDSSSTPAAGPPARIDVTVAPTANLGAGTSGGAFTVKVSDAKGAAVPNAVVTFSTTGTATVSPLTATTDASGSATTQVTAGTAVGTATLRATVTGVTNAATAAITVIAAPATKIVVTPKTLRLLSLGDTARVSATAQDQYGNLATGSAVTYSVVDGTLVSVDPTGLVRVLRLGGTTFVISTSNNRSDTTTVTVLAAGSTSCTGLATPLPMNVGDVQTLSGAQYGCFSGSGTGAEFAMVAFNSSTDQTNSLGVSLTGSAVGTAPLTSLMPTGTPTAFRSVTGAPAPAAPQLDERFHLQLLEQVNQQFKGIIGRTRTARNLAPLRSVTGVAGTTTSALGTIPATAQVGDYLTLNVSAGVCTNPTYHALQVVAVGSKSIVLNDTLNPPGFVAADYQRFAANFDTLVYPLDVNAYGAPSDIDANGRVAILFTRTVNELVNASTGYFVGGFFNPRDIFPKKGATAADDCPGSNEGEMFYMVVPATGAGINGVTHTVGFVDSLTTGIIAHEFQHLINATRRMYVNNAAQDFEEVWLNEGLSHIAEELLYYRESGFSPRQDLNDSTIRIINRPKYGYFKNDAVSNFSRFLAYLKAPSSNTPIALDDQLATRGSTWSFLRYMADRLGTTDGTIWQRMDNSTVTGLATLSLVYGSDPMPFFRDWAVSNYLDDLGVNSDPRFQQPSWNFRNIYTTTFLNMPTYPLLLTGLVNNTKTDFQIRGGSAAYVRFAVPAATEALITFSSGGGLPSAPFQFVVIRTK